MLNRTGATPFLLAAMTADVPLMRVLVKLGADPLLPNADHCTPLMAAAGIGTLAPGEEAGTEAEALEAVELALELGADVNAVDDNGETAMHGAAYKNLPKVVQFLADKGAKIEVWNRKNKYGWTPLSIAEGHRPGNFKPSPETVAALHRVMLAAGLSPPPRRHVDRSTQRILLGRGGEDQAVKLALVPGPQMGHQRPSPSGQVLLEEHEPGGLLVAERPVGLVADGVP